MDEVERLPCPLCAEPVALEARLCPHCRNAALVDLVIEGQSQDSRQRYQVARAVSGLGAPFPSFVESQQSLAGGGPAAWNLTLGEARRAVEGLKRLNVAAKTVPASGRGQFDETLAEGDQSPFRRPAVYGLVAAAVVGGFFLWRRAPASTPPPAAAVLPAVAPVAGRPPGVAQPGAAPPLSNAALARKALPSIVSLRCGNSIGSGFFVAADLVMTNAHVLCGGTSSPVTIVFSDGRRATGTPSRIDERLDLALVQVAGETGPPLELGDAGTLSVGEPLMMIGSPLGYEFTVHQAGVSNVSRPLLGISYLQIEARINPGNMAGPVGSAVAEYATTATAQHPRWTMDMESRPRECPNWGLHKCDRKRRILGSPRTLGRELPRAGPRPLRSEGQLHHADSGTQSASARNEAD